MWQRLRKQEGVLASSHRGIPEMGMSPEKAGRRWGQGWESRAECTRALLEPFLELLGCALEVSSGYAP